MMLMGFFAFYWHKQDHITIGSIVGIVCWVSCFCAMIGSLDMAVIDVHGKPIIWTKYLEFCINCPMLVAIMCASYNASTHKTLRIASLTASYCICGIAAVATTRKWLQVYFLTIGCLICAFVTIRLLQIAQTSQRRSRVSDVNLALMCISYPIVVCLWGLSDIYQVISIHNEFFIETILMAIIKTTAILYCFTDEEYTSLQNIIWELPAQGFYVARSLVYNIHLHYA